MIPTAKTGEDSKEKGESREIREDRRQVDESSAAARMRTVGQVGNVQPPVNFSPSNQMRTCPASIASAIDRSSSRVR